MQNGFSLIYSYLNACGGKPLSQISKFSKGMQFKDSKNEQETLS